MDDVKEIKKQVMIYGFIVVVVCEVISFFVQGFDPMFLTFLFAGYLAAVINFNIIAFFLKKMLASGNASYSALSLLVRILIYCAVFFIAIKQGVNVGVGCLLGFLAPKVPLYYFHAVKPDFNKDREIRPEVQAMYDEEDEKEEETWKK